MPVWKITDMPDQSNRVAVVTGANSGLGLKTTLELARRHAHVVMAVRNMKKAEEAVASIQRELPKADLNLMALDLASLDSIRQFAENFNRHYDKLDLLYNNAGLMAVPLTKTADGFEMQFGVNHLGHFALNGLIISKMLGVPGSRVVTMTSTAALMGKGISTIFFDDINLERFSNPNSAYARYVAYCQSKFANLVYANELQRRLAQAGAETISVSAQPGFVMTELQHRAGHSSGNKMEQFIYNRIIDPFIAIDIEIGILSQLYAGTAPDVKPGGFYSPSRWHVGGYPRLYHRPRRAWSETLGQRLWQVSEEMTGVYWPSLAKSTETINAVV